MAKLILTILFFTTSKTINMKTKTINVYSFDELSDKAKEKAIEKLYDINVSYDWWESTYEDASNVGITIKGFDIDRGSHCKVEIDDCEYTATTIMGTHGKDCETYKNASEFLESVKMATNTIPVVFEEGTEDEYEDYSELEDKIEELSDEFKHSISEDYRIMLQNEYEYLTSREAIIETIEANDYEFDEDGNLL